MRKLIVTEFMTLDGSIGAPMWSAPYWGDDIAAFKGEETSSSDTLLLGRVTYEGFAQAWPPQGDDEASGARYFNNVEKVVVTSTLDNLDWNNSHVLQGGLEQGVRELKAREGKDICVHGSATLAKSLIKAGLVDELRLLIYPADSRRGTASVRRGRGNEVDSGRVAPDGLWSHRRGLPESVGSRLRRWRRGGTPRR
jgi:dihydrofolate reductase